MNGIGNNIVMRRNNIVYVAEISPSIKLSPCIIQAVSITRALKEDCRSGEGSGGGSRPENSPLCRGIELDYLAIHAEPLAGVFEEQVKKSICQEGSN